MHAIEVDTTEHVSILKFIERNWNLKPLTARSRDNPTTCSIPEAIGTARTSPRTALPLAIYSISSILIITMGITTAGQ